MMDNTLKQLVEDNPGFFDIGTPASREYVSAAEEFLGVEFPESFVEYLTTWGTIAEGPLEFYGIAGTDFRNGRVPNGIWFTQLKRGQVGLPKSLVIVLNNEGDEYYCVDTDDPGGRVVVWDVCSQTIISQKAENILDLIVRDAREFLDLC